MNRSVPLTCFHRLRQSRVSIKRNLNDIAAAGAALVQARLHLRVGGHLGACKPEVNFKAALSFNALPRRQLYGDMCTNP